VGYIHLSAKTDKYPCPSVIDIFRALSDEVRLRILAAVMGAELSVAELVEVLGLPQSTVSRHLKPLREAGLTETRREGTSVYYRRGALLGEPDLAPLLEQAVAGVAQRGARCGGGAAGAGSAPPAQPGFFREGGGPVRIADPAGRRMGGAGRRPGRRFRRDRMWPIWARGRGR
jgi:DNA-binding transcriptional ArsR family regulator